MGPRDLFRMAIEALAAHRLRTRLTVLAVAIGVASVLLLVSLGTSARGYVERQFAGVGSNLLIVLPGKVETTGGPPLASGATRDLTLEDADALTRQVPRVTGMAPISLGTMLARAGNKSRTVMVIGTNHEFLPLRNLEVLAGSNLPPMDTQKASQVALIGTKIRRELYGEKSPLGEVMMLGEYRFRVIGLISPKGMSMGLDIDEMVIVPVANVMRMVNRRGLFRVLLQLGSFQEATAAKEDVRRLLAERHDKEDFTLITQQAVMDSLGEILRMLTLALSAIASISLAVAGVLTMNVMLISVSERRQEIGLCKALGASDGQVLSLFLAEAATLTLMGGVAGVLLGLVGAQVVAVLVPKLGMTTPVWAIEAALGVAVGVGLVFGVLPAARAARLAPVEALRGGKV